MYVYPPYSKIATKFSGTTSSYGRQRVEAVANRSFGSQPGPGTQTSAATKQKQGSSLRGLNF